MYVLTPLYLETSAIRTRKEERTLFSNLSVKKFKGCYNFDYIPLSVLIKNSFKVMMNKDFLKVLEDVMDEEDMVVKEEDFLKVIKDAIVDD